MSNEPREWTGRHVLIVTLLAFGTIIAVNVFMAVNAVKTFPGVESHTPYNDSQEFQAVRAAQEALGWTTTLSYQPAAQELVLTVTDPLGQPVKPLRLEATMGRATIAAEDFAPEFAFDAGRFVAPADLGPGNWTLHLTATAEDGTPFKRRLPLYIRASEVQG